MNIREKEVFTSKNGYIGRDDLLSSKILELQVTENDTGNLFTKTPAQCKRIETLMTLVK